MKGTHSVFSHVSLKQMLLGQHCNQQLIPLIGFIDDETMLISETEVQLVTGWSETLHTLNVRGQSM